MTMPILASRRSMHAAVLVSVAFVLPLCGGVAAAQTMAGPAAAPAAQPPAGASAQPDASMMVHSVRTVPDDPAKVAAARQFVIAYHPNIDPKNIRLQVEKMLPRMVAIMKQEDPKADLKKFEQERRAFLINNAMQTLDTQAQVISRHFTLQELTDLTNYFRGGVGKKLAEEIPKIQMEIMTQRRQQTLMQPVPGMKAQAPAAPPKGVAPHK